MGFFQKLFGKKDAAPADDTEQVAPAESASEDAVDEPAVAAVDTGGDSVTESAGDAGDAAEEPAVAVVDTGGDSVTESAGDTREAVVEQS